MGLLARRAGFVWLALLADTVVRPGAAGRLWRRISLGTPLETLGQQRGPGAHRAPSAED